jgi:hypothetical protein
MKQILFLILVTMFSFICTAQTNKIAQKDSSAFTLQPFQYYFFKGSVNNPTIFSDYAFDFRNTSRFTLYKGSTSLVLYDNFKHEYFLNDPLQPYSNFQSALLGGSLNYLFRLMDKKK